MRLNISEIPELLHQHQANHPGNDHKLETIKARIRRDRRLTLDDLSTVCHWKAPRAAGHARKNTPEEVQEISRIALTSKIERIRVESLRLLHGVNYPTASVVLHFFHEDSYPIIDFRALWAMDITQPKSYSFADWWPYVEACRTLFTKARKIIPSLTMRELDRALWQYSENNQPKAKKV
jgi:hypothetical protein